MARKMTHRNAKVLAAVARAGDDGITVNGLVDAAYGTDPEGGPLDARGCIYLYVHKLKRQGFIYARGRTHRTRYYHHTVPAP